MSATPALDAAIDLLDTMLDPEEDGWAVPEHVRCKAYVVRSMLRRQRQRQIETEPCQE